MLSRNKKSPGGEESVVGSEVKRERTFHWPQFAHSISNNVYVITYIDLDGKFPLLPNVDISAILLAALVRVNSVPCKKSCCDIMRFARRRLHCCFTVNEIVFLEWDMLRRSKL